MTDLATIQPAIARALAKRGYETLTPVQEAVLAPELRDADLLVSAQTGSGKTVAFGISLAPTLMGEEEALPRAEAPLAIAIAPTRELAMQVERELAWLYAEAGARIATCVGGMNMTTERRTLERGAHIVVGTPGRLRDHIERGSLDLSAIRAVVLDEADEMLDLGFRDDLQFILDAAPDQRRTLMFSATVPAGIANLAKRYQNKAVRVTTAGDQKQHLDIEYRALAVAPNDRENAVINVLRYYDAKNAIVFCSTRATVNHLTARFSNRGFSVVALSGELSQNERTHALQALRDGRAKVCVATDVAARGLDLPDLELVIHADLPKNPESLLHRSGRTGRAGRKGVSALIVPYNARRRTERLLSDARIAAAWARPPSVDEILARDDERLMEDASFVADVAEDEAAMVAALLERHGADKVAAALVRLHRAGRSSPEELIDDGPVSAPGGASGGTFAERAPREHVAIKDAVWFSLSLGRKQSAEPRWLLPMICRAGHITKNEIGSIRIHDLETHVEIAGVAADKFEAAIGPTRKIEKNVTVTRLSGVPEAPSRPPRPARSSDAETTSAPRMERQDQPGDDYRPREKAKPDYAKKRPFTGGKKRDDRPPRHDAYADRKPSPRDDAPAPAKAGGWPYDDAPPAGKPEKASPEPAAARPAPSAKAADAGIDRPFAKDKKPFAKDKKPKRDKPGAKADFKPDFKPGAKPAKPHRKGEKNPLADVTKRVTADGGKGGLKRKPKA
ncbi:MAG: DEAD/DEAH box helicase [Hoeflea sp.]|uniref:DEAD/DEAH box helicase n=1 Tax=Hoeflea sp. TaxID=1940281 RepID=UPI001D637383|nr:DEAD/DEAH box helicase [Hoeflea sp.]MBU4529075.1 DEAD/DEAH box helicase [Alphaproteobacteria bacterium]MBU4543480.1 DEAD/DEAH box helicase [Alphaproteobacteria bacterium]MBU4549105.1 DEAD/DEAH box helicase [Alphaproteobacteria bacterium]MBV1725240.1 DEAD/DEAH box helicase [Hoeflea sp.]MBV1785201.1 DEAD/DEAH box helicase [Hoeflea sp.]